MGGRTQPGGAATRPRLRKSVLITLPRDVHRRGVALAKRSGVVFSHLVEKLLRRESDGQDQDQG
jgi:hypothetical protein